MKKIFKFLVFILVLFELKSKDLYDAMKGNVIPLNMNNYRKQLN